ncbi:MAG: DUF72 domain-containing protein [Chloroflexota bacterium]
MNLYLGCPIWSFKGWVGNFYPKGAKPADFLHEYARRLTTIEGNTTFYAIPAPKTIESWIDHTPETFRFCPKIPKAISHNGKLLEYADRALYFMDVMRPLAARLGPLFLQLPPRYSPNLLGDLEAFLSRMPSDLRLAVEVRHLDWFDPPYREALNQLLASRNMARVTIDTRPIRSLEGDQILAGSLYESLLEARERKPDVPVFMERTSDFIFLRFISHPDLSQNIEIINEWVEYLVPQMEQNADVFIFCHSPDNLIAPEICREFHRRIAAKINIPPLPWDALKPDIPEQPSLF